jgi:ribosomal-protein-alanine N-acetyltransferase
MATPPRPDDPRLSLREVTEADIPFLREITHTEGWLRFIGPRGTETEEGAREYLQTSFREKYRRHGFALWVLEMVGAGPVGLVGLVPREELPIPDLGYALLPDWSGRGLLQASVPAILRWAREALGLQSVPAYIAPENERSRHTLQHLGFHWVQTTHIDIFRPGLTECWEIDLEADKADPPPGQEKPPSEAYLRSEGETPPLPRKLRSPDH